MAEEGLCPGLEPSSELSHVSDITDPYHTGELMDVGDAQDARDARDDRDGDDDDEDDADVDTNANARTEIVLETTTCWEKLRIQQLPSTPRD